MINSLKGKVLEIDEKCISIEAAQSGMAFEVCTPNITSFEVGKETSLQIYMHWNAEQGPSLYGFTTKIEKTIFSLIISCSGIGPKLGVNILSQMDANTFISLITKEDIKALSSLNGIGKKKAEQIVVQLKHKVKNLIEQGITLGNDPFARHWHQVQEVLISLNYSRQEISSVHTQVKTSYDEQETFDQLLKKSLSYLAKTR